MAGKSALPNRLSGMYRLASKFPFCYILHQYIHTPHFASVLQPLAPSFGARPLAFVDCRGRIILFSSETPTVTWHARESLG